MGEAATPMWSAEDLEKWIPLIDSKVLKYGIKEKIKRLSQLISLP